jgi:hypothetical protein
VDFISGERVGKADGKNSFSLQAIPGRKDWSSMGTLCVQEVEGLGMARATYVTSRWSHKLERLAGASEAGVGVEEALNVSWEDVDLAGPHQSWGRAG